MGKTPYEMGKSAFLLFRKTMGKSVMGFSEMGISLWAKTCGQKFDGQNSVNRLDIVVCTDLPYCVHGKSVTLIIVSEF